VCLVHFIQSPTNAMGKTWHPPCFKCTECRKQLAPDRFFEKNGKPYCEDDFHKLFSPKCAGCHKPIKDVYDLLYQRQSINHFLTNKPSVKSRQRRWSQPKAKPGTLSTSTAPSVEKSSHQITSSRRTDFHIVKMISTNYSHPNVQVVGVQSKT